MAESCNHRYKSGSVYCTKCGQMRQGSAWGRRDASGGRGTVRAPFKPRGNSGGGNRRNWRRGYGRKRGWGGGAARRRGYGRKKGTAARILRFVAYSIVATIILYGILYLGEWFVNESLPLQNGGAPRTAERSDGGADVQSERRTENTGSEDEDVFAWLERSGSSLDSHTAEEESRENLAYINKIRSEHGAEPIEFDVRAYKLAHARILDVLEYDYRDHVNPYTGTCPYTMKSEYGFASHEDAAENLAWIEGFGHMGPNRAVGMWMDSPGHRANLLFPSHTGGATACDGGVCVFIGVNTGMLGNGCFTAAEGEAYWRAQGVQ